MTPEKIWLAFADDNGALALGTFRLRAWTVDPERAKSFRENEGLAMLEFNIVDSPADSLASIASSMKRIADEIQGNPNRLGLVSGIMTAIEQGFIAGRNG